MSDYKALQQEAHAEQAYARKQAVIDAGGVFKSDELKKRNVKYEVPTLPEPVREVPVHFQELLDEFNHTTGERLIAYYNPIAVPKVSKTINITGTYTILDKEGRWELWRPIPETLTMEDFIACDPTLIRGFGMCTRLWTIQDNVRSLPCCEYKLDGSVRNLTATVGDYREPDERDIKILRWCDTARTPEGAQSVMEEIYGKWNERIEEDAEKEFDDLAEGLANYYWGMPRVQVGPGSRGNWRKAADII